MMFLKAQSKLKPYLDKVAFANCSEDFVDRTVGWQSAVEDIEVTFQTLGNVVTTSTRMNHGSHHLNIHDVCKFSRFLQVEESLPFDHLPSDLIGNLKMRDIFFL